MSDIPVIDLGPYFDQGQTGSELVAQQINQAMLNVGFFMVRNHGIDKKIIGDLFESSKQYFDLPLSEKQKLAMSEEFLFYGYENKEILSNSIKFDENSVSDNKETFQVSFEEEKIRIPERPERFAGDLKNYYQQAKQLTYHLCLLFEQALKLEKGTILNVVSKDKQEMSLRCLNYPNIDPESYQPGRIRASAHRGGAIFWCSIPSVPLPSPFRPPSVQNIDFSVF